MRKRGCELMFEEERKWNLPNKNWTKERNKVKVWEKDGRVENLYWEGGGEKIDVSLGDTIDTSGWRGEIAVGVGLEREWVKMKEKWICWEENKEERDEGYNSQLRYYFRISKGNIQRMFSIYKQKKLTACERSCSNLKDLGGRNKNIKILGWKGS